MADSPLRLRLFGALLLIGAAVLAFGDGISVPGLSTKPTAVTYVYEKDQTAVPNPVLAVLNELNRQNIVATTFEEDTVDGSGETPDQYKAALAAAREKGLPALVATAGDRVLKVVKDPKTEPEAREVVQ